MDRKSGLIYTDSLRLAAKYGCGRERICAVLDDFVSESRSVGMEWEVLDLGDHSYDFFFERGCSWTTYLEILDEFSVGMGLDGREGLGLFIVGGDDVIPMPRVINEAAKPGAKDGYLEADYLYCFALDRVIVDSAGRLDFSILMSSPPRFNVGRLPLEDGDLKTTPEKDLGGYFYRSVNEYRMNGCRGIKVSNMLVTVTADAENTGAELARNIPVLTLPSNVFFKNNFALSPEHDLRISAASALYRDALMKADSLLFVLHGGSTPGRAIYCGHRNRQFYPAFDLKCLNSSSARVINAVCCWGARYVGYERDDSILLSAIYGQTLLFAGACRTVPGRFRRQFHSIFPIGFGESFLKYYINYLFQGYDAGQAMMRSKQEYFSTFAVVDTPEMAFGTITMFNLFGNPLLNVEPILKQSPVLLTDGIDFPGYTKGWAGRVPRTQYEIVYQPGQASKGSFPGIGDSVLQFVKNQWGWTGDKISFIRRFHAARGNGYQFCFEELYDGFVFSVCVETDLSGSITDVIYEY